MKLSVVIPAYNASATIRAALDSALNQTRRADEVLVLNDGSTDFTLDILRSYGPSISVYSQDNRGLASARNFLCKQAKGDLIAFLDADDIWHPEYVETQISQMSRYPSALAGFTEHVVFSQTYPLRWPVLQPSLATEVIEYESFFQRYNSTPGLFYPSFCCVRRELLNFFGDEPFPPIFRRAEDFWFMNNIPLLKRPLLLSHRRLAAYQITEGSLSSNQLANKKLAVKAFAMLEPKYLSHPEFIKPYFSARASLLRGYAKLLLDANLHSDARSALVSSMRKSDAILSIAKSFALLFLSFCPRALRPQWQQLRKA